MENELFGDFKPVEETESENTKRTFRAVRQGGSSKEQYFIKVVLAPSTQFPLLLSPAAEPHPGAVPAGGPSWELELIKNAIEPQRTACAQGARFIAPVFAHQHDSRGVWSVTGYCQHSLAWAAAMKMELQDSDLTRLVHQILLGLLELKRCCGRTHGNLRPTNILFPKEVLGNQLWLTDLAVATPWQSARCETHDLRRLGQILDHLVGGREFRIADDKLYNTCSRSEDWNRLGDRGDFWRNLCQRLLECEEDHPRPDDLQLEALEVLLRPKAAPTRRIVIYAAALLLFLLVTLGVIAWFLRSRPPHVELLNVPPSMNVELLLGLSTNINWGRAPIVRRDPKGALAARVDSVSKFLQLEKR